MAIVGAIEKPAEGRPLIHKIMASGPDADTSVDAGAEAELTLTASVNLNVTNGVFTLGEIKGLPAGVIPKEVRVASVSRSSISIVVKVYNATSAAVTISAGSVSVTGAFIESY